QDVTLTYGQLNDFSEALAWTLYRRGFRRGNIAAVMLERSVNTLVAIMGVLKAGGAYLPLDFSHPCRRNEKILNDSGATLLVTTSQLICNSQNTRFKFEDNQIVYLDLEDKESQSQSSFLKKQLPNFKKDTDLAYVMFTSGSTGEPKGVIIEEKNVINLVNSLEKTVFKDFYHSLNIAMVSPYIFDASVQQIFSSLLLGHTLFIVPEDVRLNGKKLVQFYNDNKIDISDGTPAHIRILDYTLKITNQKLCVRHFLIGGEELRAEVIIEFLSKFDDSPPQITNVYGPTECCVDSSSYQIDLITIKKLGFVPIGKALSNISIYILNEQLQSLENGEAGEICIAGAGVGRGYINKKDLTEQKFIQNPFNSSEKLYKTGDIGRLLPDKNIQFLGRRDRQVKLRGYRIDLKEIESALYRYKNDSLANSKKERPEYTENQTQLVICEKCLLNSRYPGITFERGICSVCRQYEKYKKHFHSYFKSLTDFKALMKKAKTSKSSIYDCLLLFSGGKDSTYTLFRLLEMGFNVLTLTFDNGFISKTAFKNISRITNQFDIPHITCSTENMNEIFLESLNSDSTVCSGCFRALTLISNRVAKEKGINVIITGLSRGQILETKLQPLLETGIDDLKEIDKRLSLHRKMYYFQNDKISNLLNIPIDESLLENMYFLDYFQFDNSTVSEIKDYLSSQDNYWQKPQDTGLCSSNCRINDVGIFVHKTEKGFHNYAASLSWDCRLGLLKRNEGFKLLKEEVNSPVVDEILSQLKYIPKIENTKPIQNVAVVLKQERCREPFLCSYFVANSTVNINELREYLFKELPEYMIPARFIQVESLPLTNNGKIDFVSLSLMPGKNKFDNSIIDSISDTEQKLLGLWSKVLGQPSIGIDDNFFEVGGDSVSVTILISLVEKEFNVEFSIENALSTPTIKGWATLLSCS
nr:amino acid adenylation domain-containing protein [Xenococcaceae cyanobacterium MO_188.B29]